MHDFQVEDPSDLLRELSLEEDSPTACVPYGLGKENGSQPVILLATDKGELHPILMGPRIGQAKNTVFSAFDLYTKETIALKASISNSANLREAKREIAALSQFDRFRGHGAMQHPDGKIHFVGQKIIAGGDVDKYIKSVQEATIGSRNQEFLLAVFDEIDHIAKEFCIEVESYHQKKYIHRDIKPANMMIMKSKHGLFLTMIDFGGMVKERRIAKDVDSDYGTKAYLAPELSIGAKHSRATDAYAVGKSLEELLRLVEAGSFIKIRALKRSDEYARLKGVVQGLTHPDPVTRLTVSEAQQILEQSPKPAYAKVI
jgi:serine/threonine protein kinase